MPRKQNIDEYVRSKDRGAEENNCSENGYVYEHNIILCGLSEHYEIKVNLSFANNSSQVKQISDCNSNGF